MSRVPSVEPSSPTSTSSVEAGLDRHDGVEQPLDGGALVVDGDENAEGLWQRSAEPS